MGWILRVALAGCFVGHGAYGILTKSDWCPFFAVVGIEASTAYQLMPLIGGMDILLGLLVLFYPLRGLVMWMLAWATWTALCRPLSGSGWWEFLERAGNYGVPLALLILGGLLTESPIRFGRFETLSVKGNLLPLDRALRFTLASLLIGHGGFCAFTQKPMLLAHWASVGLPLAGWNPLTFLIGIGLFEFSLGIWVLLKPNLWLVGFIFFWKVFTELLYPVSGTLFWEFVERFGSYGTPLALLNLRTLRRPILSKQEKARL